MSLTHDTTDARLRVPVSAYEPDIEKVLISTEEIESALATMGEQITKDYAGKSLLLVGVLKGAFVVMADLARHIGLPLEFDFMAVSSYGAATKTSGVVRILKDLDHDLDGVDVLLVEDIVDSGLTLKYLLKNLAARKPSSWRWPRSCGRRACRKCRSTSATWGSRSPPSSWSATVSTTPSATATSRTSRP